MRDPKTLIEVKKYLDLLSKKAPGYSVEVRIPSYGAIQCIEGPIHRRGNPRAVVEMDAKTFIALAIGDLNWETGLINGLILAYGENSNLNPYLPLITIHEINDKT